MTGADIQGEQIRTLYRQTQTVLIANCVNAAIVSALLWASTSHPLLVGWVAATALLTLSRAVLALRYRRAEPQAGEARAWGARYVLGSALSGALWGAAGFVFLEDASPV
jgi:hypothetical protein